VCNKAITDTDFLANLPSLRTLDLSRNMDLRLTQWAATARTVDVSESKLTSSALAVLLTSSYDSLNLSNNVDLFRSAEDAAFSELCSKCADVNATDCSLSLSQVSTPPASPPRKLNLTGCLADGIHPTFLFGVPTVVLENNKTLDLGALVPLILENGVTDLDLGGCGLLEEEEEEEEENQSEASSSAAFPSYLAFGSLARVRLFNNKLHKMTPEQVGALAPILARIGWVDVSGNDMKPEMLSDLLLPQLETSASTTELELGGNSIDSSVEELIKRIQAVRPVDIPRDIPSASAPMTIAGGGGNVMGGGGVVEDDSIADMMRQAGWKTGGGA
jgi:hypothetical protein